MHEIEAITVKNISQVITKWHQMYSAVYTTSEVEKKETYEYQLNMNNNNI